MRRIWNNRNNRNNGDNEDNKDNMDNEYPTNFGLNNYFKAAICLILASNTPPPHPMPPPPLPPPATLPRHGVGLVRELTLSQLSPESVTFPDR